MGEIAADTCNFPANIQKEERAVLGKAACELNISAGSLVKDLWLKGAEQLYPELAEKIKQIRASRYVDALAIILFGSVAAGVLFQSLDKRNHMPRRVSVRQLIVRRADV